MDDAQQSTVAALLRLGQRRDEDAWRTLVERHGSMMYRAAYAVTRDEHLAADACQEAFLRLRDGARRFRPRADDAEAAAVAWLKRLAVTAALLLLRGLRRRRRRERQMPDDRAAAPAEMTDEAGLREVVEALPGPQREALLLHVYGGLDHAAVAQALGISPGNARVRVHRALERLRARLGRAEIAVALPLLAPPTGLQARWLALLRQPSAPTLPATLSAGWSAGRAAITLAAAMILALTLVPRMTRVPAAAPPVATFAADAANAPGAPPVDPATLPANAWVRVQPDWSGAPAGHHRPMGAGNRGAWHARSGRVLLWDQWYDELRRPGSYGNAVLAFDPVSRRAEVVRLGA
ncbi:MAG TPA: RNA polymerase sigma factor, partial [Planctomycetota bacterium]|nr:RNA polymerase sigma factor [Planctomycetota bacterium]